MAFGARRNTVMLEINVRLFVCTSRRRQLGDDRAPDRLRRPWKVVCSLPVAEPRRDASDSRIDGQHGLAAREQQHAIRTAVTAHTRQVLQLADGFRSWPFDPLGEPGIVAEDLD